MTSIVNMGMVLMLALLQWSHTARVEAGTVIAVHSQSTSIPYCPSGMTRMWEGYSMLAVEGNGVSNAQDLGSAGSCVERFSTLPFFVCDNPRKCFYGARPGKSYWLTTSTQQPAGPITGEAITKYISRCVVCFSSATVLAVHSQSLQLPDCPVDMTPVWFGYSFLLATGAGSSGGGQPLSSPGSCLQAFLAPPVIECNGALGTCFFFADGSSVWLATIDTDRQFDTPVTDTMNGRSRSSRCTVCRHE